MAQDEDRFYTQRLEKAAACLAAAVRPGGVLLLEPWFTEEKWLSGSPHMNTFSDVDLKVCRQVVSRNEGPMSIMDMHWLVARRNGEVTHHVDHHEMYMCPHDRLVAIFEAAGFEMRLEPGILKERGLFVGVR